MSKGSPVITLRIPQDMLDEMDSAIGSANWHSKIEPYRRASWIKAAIKQKLDHIKRSKKGKINAPANSAIPDRS